MSAEEQKIIDFVLHLPSNVNPYSTVARYMRSQIIPPALPSWVSRIQYFAGFLCVMVLGQALFLMQARIRLKEFSFTRFSQLGLLHLDIASTTSVMYSLFAPLAIADLILMDLVSAGRLDLYPGQIILMVYKPIVIMNLAWAFAWFCACQCASIIYESPLRKRSMPQMARWTMIAFFLGVTILPIPMLLYIGAKASIEYDAISSIISEVVQNLLAQAPHINPRTYKPMALLLLMLPAKGVIPHLSQIKDLSTFAQSFYLCIVIILIIFYCPLLFFTLRRLYARSVSQKHVIGQVGGTESESYDRSAKANRKIRNQRNRLVWHAFAALGTTIMNVPTLALGLYYDEHGQSMGKGRLILLRVGEQIPFAIAANIILGILNFHSHRQIQEMKFKKNPEQNQEKKNTLPFTSENQNLSEERWESNQDSRSISLFGKMSIYLGETTSQFFLNHGPEMRELSDSEVPIDYEDPHYVHAL
ncbi:hypothetical protein CROQUDRAFT_656394 [Cronartium quercuum f. sp. fusiforme G11]|uniref:Uncharacterized protein n=1 Tax=Cronartium quercuum f. sp. fusiforme G11 TaxID=708437 RepID=A0A9P6NHX0_9BASI|nr:hypothetical protein CROQUDRAFT_656394 [Cronartium quercuum f. sp. fusiforme G11]